MKAITYNGKTFQGTEPTKEQFEKLLEAAIEAAPVIQEIRDIQVMLTQREKDPDRQIYIENARNLTKILEQLDEAIQNCL